MRKNTQGEPEKVKAIKTYDEVTTASSREQSADRQTDRQQKIASQHLQVKCYKRPVEKHFILCFIFSSSSRPLS